MGLEKTVVPFSDMILRKDLRDFSLGVVDMLR